MKSPNIQRLRWSGSGLFSDGPATNSDVKNDAHKCQVERRRVGVEGRKVCDKCETVGVKFVTGVRQYTAQKK